MRVVFVTHNELGLACLEELEGLGADIRAIYTRPDEMDIADKTDLDTFADRHSVPLHRTGSINADPVKRQINEYDPDVLFVVGWSSLVKPSVLGIPSVAALGMHPSPLPRGRGRAPIAWSLIKGLDETALSLFHLVEKADAGDLVGQEPIPITEDDDAGSLYEKVVDAGRALIRRYFSEIAEAPVPRTSQDDSVATWWPKREPHQGLIDWTSSPTKVYNWIRGQAKPYPGAFSYLGDRKITIWSANPPADIRHFVPPGEISYRERKALGVGTWEGIVEIKEVQVEEDLIPASRLITEYGFSVGDSFENARDRLR